MKSKLFYNILHVSLFTVLLCTLNIKCAKTEDVVPIDNTMIQQIFLILFIMDLF